MIYRKGQKGWFVPRHARPGQDRGGGGPELPDGLDHAEAHFHTAVGVVLAGLRKPGDAVVAVPQDFDTKTVMLLEGTGGGEDRVSQHTGQCRRRAWRRGARAQEVCTLGSGAPTLDKSLSYLPRKLGGTPNRAWVVHRWSVVTEKQLGFGFQGYRAPCRPCHVLVSGLDAHCVDRAGAGWTFTLHVQRPPGNPGARSVFLLKTCVRMNSFKQASAEREGLRSTNSPPISTPF